MYFFFPLLVVQCLSLSLSSAGVQVQEQDNQVVMDNGILQVSIANPKGYVLGIKYKDIENLLDQNNSERDRGYWDHNYLSEEADNYNSGTGSQDRVEATDYTVVLQTEDQVELSFTRMWDPSLEGKLPPLNIDIRYVLLRDSSGFYSYAIFEHLKEWHEFMLFSNRMVYKLDRTKFHFMAVSDNQQREMPRTEDRNKGKPLAYPEAVKLPDGEVDDKYQYSMDAKDMLVHGWISDDPVVGMWQILPSSESRSFGPFKQFLTSHAGPISLNNFHSTHYMGEYYGMNITKGETWKKVFGPLFVYINSEDDRQKLWEDAKKQFTTELEHWPYKFPASKDFQKPEQRGGINGRLLVEDKYVNEKATPGKGAFVILAAPGAVSSWQTEPKGYQFWTIADDLGRFSIDNVVTGDYNLYASVPGFIADYHNDAVISITAGATIEFGDLVFKPPRDGPTLWEIGIPDRTAAEFFVPDPNPEYVNKFYVNHPDRYRQYGLWERYSELYPDGDLVYTVDVSDFRKDWFFAHVPRQKDKEAYEPTTWQIKFKLDNVDEKGIYKLRLALASASSAKLRVRVNDPEADPPLFSDEPIGHDNAIARHGIHGLYWLFNIDVPGAKLIKAGDNTIFLTQARADSPFCGIMYDYIRFEGPPSSN